MKITKQELVDLIKEELDALLNEVVGAPVSGFSKWRGAEELEARIAAGESSAELQQDYPSMVVHPSGLGKINIAQQQSEFIPGEAALRDIALASQGETGIASGYEETLPGEQLRSYPTSAHRRMGQALDKDALRQQRRRREEQPLVRTVASEAGRET